MKRGSPIVELVTRFGLMASLVVTVVLARAIWQKVAALKAPVVAEVMLITNAPVVVKGPILQVTEVATNNADPFCGFEWREVYSTNLVTYASILVALGCPSKTMHAVLTVDTLRQCERDIEALPEPPFWADSETRTRMGFEKVLQQEQIRNGYSFLLGQLTGEHLRAYRDSTDLHESFLLYTIVSVLAGPIEQERRMGLLELVAKVDELDNHRVPEPFEREWKRQQGQQFATAVQSLLKPAELDGFFARLLCMTGDEGVVGLAGSAAELQQISGTVVASMRPRFFEMLEKGLDDDETEYFFKSALLSNLPDDKKWTFLQAEDSGFRAFSEPLSAAANRGGVLEAIWGANALLTEIEIDPGLDVNDKLREIQQGRMATAAAVLGLIGETEFARVWPAIDRWLGTRQDL